jgi:hypothetical protein
MPVGHEITREQAVVFRSIFDQHKMRFKIVRR